MTKHSRKPKNSQQKALDQAPQNYVYKSGDLELPVIFKGNDGWLSQKDMAQLFEVDVRTINYHINNLAESNEVPDSVIQEIRITASDGKSYLVSHYGLDVIIPVGYRLGSPRAASFRAFCNSILKQVILMTMAIHEKKQGSKSLLKMEKDLTLAEKYGLGERPEMLRLSNLYENKLGEELLFAIIADIGIDPNYGQIKGSEYFTLFGMYAKDLKKALGAENIRQALPDRQLMAFTLAERTLRDMLSRNTSMSNEQILEAVKLAFVPIGNYLRGTSELMGVSHITDMPLITEGKRES